MPFADSLGFPFTQKELTSHDMSAMIDPALQLDLIHATVVPPPMFPPFARTTQQMAAETDFFLGLLAKSGCSGMVKQRDDLAKPGLKVVGGLQYPPEDATVENLEQLRRLGIRFVTLAYEEESPYGGGFATPNAPLTDSGKALIWMLGQAEMVLDLSHAGERTAEEALDYVEYLRTQAMPAPLVVATHTACHAIYPHGRNLSDAVISRIGAFGGFVGIDAVTFMLDGNDNTLKPFFRHLRHAIAQVGYKAVCVGTDGIYKSLDLDTMGKNFDMMKAKLDPKGYYQARFPQEPAVLNTPAKMQVITDELRNASFSEEVVQKVTGENFLDFLRRALP